MLDTLGIRSIPGEFEISKSTPLEVYPARYTLNDGELKNDFKLFSIDGEEVSGSKAILNRDKFQITIDARGLYTQLSIPKYARGSNYRLSGESETKEVLKDLEKSLLGEGIKLNIESAIPGRLDACRNIVTNLGTGNYFSFLPSLGGSRLNQKSGYEDGIKRTGFQWSNTLQEIICYDKRIEMETREENLQGIPKNVLRFEHRLRKGKKIKDALGFFTIKDMFKDFGRIEENYNKTLRDTIFKYEPDDKRLFQSKTIADYLEYALTKHKRNKYLNFAANILFSKEGFLIDEKSLFEMLELVMDKLDYTRNQKKKQRYLLKQMLNNTREVYSGIDAVNIRELYNELRTKLKVA